MWDVCLAFEMANYVYILFITLLSLVLLMSNNLYFSLSNVRDINIIFTVKFFGQNPSNRNLLVIVMLVKDVS